VNHQPTPAPFEPGAVHRLHSIPGCDAVANLATIDHIRPDGLITITIAVLHDEVPRLRMARIVVTPGRIGHRLQTATEQVAA
jgi:hypothetical protein